MDHSSLNSRNSSRSRRLSASEKEKPLQSSEAKREDSCIFCGFWLYNADVSRFLDLESVCFPSCVVLSESDPVTELQLVEDGVVVLLVYLDSCYSTSSVVMLEVAGILVHRSGRSLLPIRMEYDAGLVILPPLQPYFAAAVTSSRYRLELPIRLRLAVELFLYGQTQF